MRCKSVLSATFALFAVASASAQQFPTVPDRSVIGRIGTGTGTGPSQAIPFATLLQFVFGPIPNNTVIGNVSGASNLSVPLTATQLMTLCNAFTSTLKGCVPASGGGTLTFLRADGTFAPPSISNNDVGSLAPAFGAL